MTTLEKRPWQPIITARFLTAIVPPNNRVHLDREPAFYWTWPTRRFQHRMPSWVARLLMHRKVRGRLLVWYRVIEQDQFDLTAKPA